MIDFILSVLKTTALQLIGILGIFFVFGVILSKLQEMTQKNYLYSIGWKGILWTAWFGTPFHELGHVFFAKIFRHKIQKIALFRPNKENGGLGYVDHTFDPGSLYQKIGNFFIGSAPLIFGASVLWALVYFLLPNGKSVFMPLMGAKASIGPIFISLKQTVFTLFNPKNITSWAFWLFLYLSFCISSHMAPSKADRKGMWLGFLWIILILIFINIFAILFKLNITKYILRMGQYLGIFIAIFLYSVIISLIHWILSMIILRPFRKIMK